MRGKTHKAFAATFATATVSIPLICDKNNIELISIIPQEHLPFLFKQYLKTNFEYGIISLIIIVLAYMSARLPDVDELAKEYHLPIKIKHRSSISHTLYALIPFIVVMYMTKDTYIYAIILGVFLGYMSHLVGDAYGVRGIDWLLINGTKVYYENDEKNHSTNNGEKKISAQIVKGNRILFPRLYKTGQRILGIPAHLIWRLIAIISIVIFYYYLFKA